MEDKENLEQIRLRLRASIRIAMHEAVENAEGSRVAALRRVRDGLLRLSSRTMPSPDLSAADEVKFRSLLASEVDAAFTSMLKDIKGR